MWHMLCIFFLTGCADSAVWLMRLGPAGWVSVTGLSSQGQTPLRNDGLWIHSGLLMPPGVEQKGQILYPVAWVCRTVEKWNSFCLWQVEVTWEEMRSRIQELLQQPARLKLS